MVLLIVYIRRGRNVRFKSSGIRGSCIVNQGHKVNTARDGIYNQAFDHEISGNPLYEGCEFVETTDEPMHFASSSLVSPNPLYGDTDDLPGYMTRQKGMSNKGNEMHLIQVSNT